MSYATNDGVRVHYEVLGEGEPLVLQHGYSQDSRVWREFGYVAPLRERYRVVLIDMRGHGQSDKPHDGQAYALRNLVRDVEAVLEDAGIQRAHYWGYSMGAWIGLGLLTQAPQRVNKTILGGVHPYERKVPPFLSDGSNAEQFLRELERRLGKDFDAFSQKMLLKADCRALAVAQGNRESHEALLSGINTPCLMYAGESDGLYAQGQKGAASIPNCTFITVTGTHLPAFQNAPAILPEALKFLG